MLVASDNRPETRVSPARPITPQSIVYRTSFVYLCPRLESAPVTSRPAATMILAASPKEFEIEIDGRRQAAGVAFVRPFVAKRVHAADVPLISVGLHPNHPMYRAFNRIPDPGCVMHRHAEFPDLLASVASAAAQPLTPQAGAILMEWAIRVATDGMPPLAPLDARVQQAMAMLVRDHTISLDELAEATCLSYFRLSHLFKQELGISLRQYVLALKIDTATQHLGLGGTLTDAAHAGGFCDSAHLTKVWVKWFGGPPTAFLKKDWFSTDPSRP